MKRLIRSISLVLALLALLSMLWTVPGCEIPQATAPGETETSLYDEDIALTLSVLLSEENGGVIDLMGDIAELASVSGGFIGKNLSPLSVRYRHAEYDSVAGLWTIQVTKERGSPGDSLYAYFSRTKTVQFLNQSGQAQKRWITAGDTAHTILVELLNGSGRHVTPRISQALQSISGSWIFTNAHTDLLTMNGTFHRAAADTLFRENATRISNHQVDLTMTDVVGPRGSRRHWSEKVSGILSGTYQATVYINREGLNITKQIIRDIHMDLGEGEAGISVAGNRFRCDLSTGQTH